ncbi:MAG TPA: hypothetical protein VHL98_16555 [Microvirga sp.]|jgi:hypothetical protein|nr:hypothetical protein [Microvirga sp.]
MTSSLEVARHLSDLQAKVDEVAERAGVSAFDRLDLRTALAALPWRERRHLNLVLESVRVHAGGSELQEAVELMLRLTAEVWTEAPPPQAH